MLGQAGQEQRHARHVAVVLACLVRGAEEDLVDGALLRGRIAPSNCSMEYAPRSSGRTARVRHAASHRSAELRR